MKVSKGVEIFEGVAALNMMWKGWVERLGGRDSAGRAKFDENVLGIAA